MIKCVRQLLTVTSLIPILSCRGGGKRTWYILFEHAPYYSATLKLMEISVYLLKATPQNFTSCETPSGCFEVRNNIALTLTGYIASFKTICKLQKERLHHAVT